VSVSSWTEEWTDGRRRGFSRIRDDDRYTEFVQAPEDDRAADALVRRVWELLARTEDLQQMLVGVAELVSPTLDVQGLGAIAFEEGSGYRFLAGWSDDISAEPGETADAFHRRVSRTTPVGLPARERRPYDQTVFDRIRAGHPVTCADLLAQPAWYEYEFALAAGGMLAYASIPAVIGDTLVGLAVFSRRRPSGFSETELRVLTNLARPVGVGIARAREREQIATLRARLADEDGAPVVHMGHAPFFRDIVGGSLAIRRTLEAIEQVAATDATVLITGETGTGKELIARAVHQRSRRAAKPFVEINCAAIPETLLAAELFGHERGAFTGAHERRAGRFEQAHGGTLFLDEIGELPPEMQVLLLRVLQTREVQRLGATTPVRTDVRVVAATNRDLIEDVTVGRFRSDLFYRLNVFPIHVPPLRDRPEDVGVLTAHLAAKYAAQFGRRVARIDRRTLAWLEAYAWPGNVRELENLVARAVIVAEDEVLRILKPLLSHANPRQPLDASLEGTEREAIETALQACRGRVSGTDGAARRLGLPPSTLESRIQRLGIDKHRFRTRPRS
jgi:formate hydrogenlyase transcriptional activator